MNKRFQIHKCCSTWDTASLSGGETIWNVLKAENPVRGPREKEHT